VVCTAVVFRCVRKIAKSDYLLCHVYFSACPHGTTQLPLDGFSLNFIFAKKLSRKFKFH